MISAELYQDCSLACRALGESDALSKTTKLILLDSLEGLLDSKESLSICELQIVDINQNHMG